MFPPPADALPSYAGVRVNSDRRFQKFLQRWSRIQPGERQRCAMADQGAGEIQSTRRRFRQTSNSERFRSSNRTGAIIIPTKDRLTICFAHIAYQMQQRLLALNTGVASSEVRDREALASRGIRLAKRQRGERPRGFRARDRSDSSR